MVEGRVFKARKTDSVLKFSGVHTEFVRNYFRLCDNLPKIASEICKDSLMTEALQTSYGLRLVRQNPWECLISYICATCKNIPAIKNMIARLSERFGEKVAFEGYFSHSFPEPNILARASLNELRRCGLGFRAKRVRETAKLVNSGRIDFETLEESTYEIAKKRLLQLPGVGNKVADCVLLFSLEKLEAFPVDVWMKQVIKTYYATHFEPPYASKLAEKKPLSPKLYKRISLFARRYFGGYAGYAQEYLFHFARNRRTRAHDTCSSRFLRQSFFSGDATHSPATRTA